MNVTFPHMGYLNVVLRSILSGFGCDVVEPPPINQETINLGTRYAPEFACLPFKVNIGNFIQAAGLGADAVVMAGGIGPCRFGYYAQVQQQILADLGVDLKMIVLEPPQGQWKQLMQGLRCLTTKASPLAIYRTIALAWAKLGSLDALAAQALFVRARESERGSTTRAWNKIVDALDRASSISAVRTAAGQGNALLRQIRLEASRQTLKVGLVGELYTVLEPAVNLEIERLLGTMGVEVIRSIYLSPWILTNLVLHALHLRDDKEHYQLAAPYLNHFIGGHGLESVSNTVRYARAGVDGVVHIAPLTCMPEIVAKSILPQISARENIPVLTLMLDEHSAETGIVTRLEAFCDLLWQRKRARVGNP
ncbi:MAG TPA: CoA protein activase [bacterium]|nr:CoA protein activase [bacterium]